MNCLQTLFPTEIHQRPNFFCLVRWGKEHIISPKEIFQSFYPKTIQLQLCLLHRMSWRRLSVCSVLRCIITNFSCLTEKSTPPIFVLFLTFEKIVDNPDKMTHNDILVKFGERGVKTVTVSILNLYLHVLYCWLVMVGLVIECDRNILAVL